MDVIETCKLLLELSQANADYDIFVIDEHGNRVPLDFGDAIINHQSDEITISQRGIYAGDHQSLAWAASEVCSAADAADAEDVISGDIDKAIDQLRDALCKPKKSQEPVKPKNDDLIRLAVCVQELLDYVNNCGDDHIYVTGGSEFESLAQQLDNAIKLAGVDDVL